MKALLPPVPVLANESQEQFEKIFDQVAARLNAQDMVELILIRDFVTPSWELARYTRHRVVAFDRMVQDALEAQRQQVKIEEARREAMANRLADHLVQRPPEVGRLLQLEEKVTEAADEMTETFKRTAAELAYNRVLEKSIELHKDLEYLITSVTKRRNEALEMLECYREGLGKCAEKVTDEILDAEYKVVENELAPPLVATSDAQNKQLEDRCDATPSIAAKNQ